VVLTAALTSGGSQVQPVASSVPSKFANTVGAVNGALRPPGWPALFGPPVAATPAGTPARLPVVGLDGRLRPGAGPTWLSRPDDGGLVVSGVRASELRLTTVALPLPMPP
jgi:hypothetical protein